ncbi:MAG: tRNA 2-selenouridine(34) synthase MnmH [Bacillota bacterium]
MKSIDIEEGLKLKNALFIDVRSPFEYNESTITGAVNIPILTDEQREDVGSVYRKESQEKATEIGLKYASSKLTDIYTSVKAYRKQYDHIIIFCWRGGMRSKTVCSLLDMLNISNVYQLRGGYKRYRKFTVDYFENHIDQYSFITLHGLTGVGKTHILEKLSTLRIPVLNLEKIAKNSGSAFGDIVFEGSPPSQKMFESDIFHTLYFCESKFLFVESESKRIGNVQIPDSIYTKIINGHHILINTSLENRINIILGDYIKHLENNNEKIIKAIQCLRKRLGNETVDLLLKKIDQKEYIFVIEYLIEHYYDPLYKYSIEKYEHYDRILEYEDIEEVIPKLKDFYFNLMKMQNEVN